MHRSWWVLAFSAVLTACADRADQVDFSEDFQDNFIQKYAKADDEDGQNALREALRHIRAAFGGNEAMMRGWLAGRDGKEVLEVAGRMKEQIAKRREEAVSARMLKIKEAVMQKLQYQEAEAAAVQRRLERRRRGEEPAKIRSVRISGERRNWAGITRTIAFEVENTSSERIEGVDVLVGLIRMGRPMPEAFEQERVFFSGGVEPGEVASASVSYTSKLEGEDLLPWVRPALSDWGRDGSPERSAWMIQRKKEILAEMAGRIDQAKLDEYFWGAGIRDEWAN